MTSRSLVMTLGWANDRQKSSATSVRSGRSAAFNVWLPTFWSCGDERLHRLPRAIGIEIAERRGHGLAQARLGAKTPDPFLAPEQRGREPFRDGAGFARQCRELCGKRITHVDR